MHSYFSLTGAGRAGGGGKNYLPRPSWIFAENKNKKKRKYVKYFSKNLFCFNYSSALKRLNMSLQANCLATSSWEYGCQQNSGVAHGLTLFKTETVFKKILWKDPVGYNCHKSSYQNCADFLFKMVLSRVGG
jgi:hypothetical protein